MFSNVLAFYVLSAFDFWFAYRGCPVSWCLQFQHRANAKCRPSQDPQRFCYSWMWVLWVAQTFCWSRYTMPKADTLLHLENRGAPLARCCCQRFMQIRRSASNCGKAGAITTTRSIMMSDVRQKRNQRLDGHTIPPLTCQNLGGARIVQWSWQVFWVNPSFTYFLFLWFFVLLHHFIRRISTCWFLQLLSKTLCLHSSHYSCVCMRWSCPYTHEHFTHIRQIRQFAGFRTWWSVILCFMSGLDFKRYTCFSFR